MADRAVEEAVLRELYLARGLTLREVARLLKASHEVIRQRLIALEIERRKPGPRRIIIGA